MEDNGELRINTVILQINNWSTNYQHANRVCHCIITIILFWLKRSTNKEYFLVVTAFNGMDHFQWKKQGINKISMYADDSAIYVAASSTDEFVDA